MDLNQLDDILEYKKKAILKKIKYNIKYLIFLIIISIFYFSFIYNNM